MLRIISRVTSRGAVPPGVRNGADDQVRSQNALLDCVDRGISRLEGRGEGQVEFLEAGNDLSRTVTSASSPRAMRRAFMPTTPPPSTTTLAADAGNAAEQNPSTPGLAFEGVRAGLDRHPSGHLGSSGQQWQVRRARP